MKIFAPFVVALAILETILSSARAAQLLPHGIGYVWAFAAVMWFANIFIWGRNAVEAYRS